MEELSLSEISNWRAFECLVADYFKEVKNDTEADVESVEIYRSGIGADGGNDIFVKLVMHDTITPFIRTWLIQCKFYDQNVNRSHLADVNIPSLIQMHNAHGYLLVCKNDVTSSLTDFFLNLKNTCSNRFNYEIWNGIDLLNRIRMKPKLIENYFPQHAKYLKEQSSKINY